MTAIAYRFGAETVDRDRLHRWLQDSYWAADRDRATLDRALARSWCHHAWVDGAMVGFARAVSDGATIAWLADVLVDPAWRRRGIATALVRGLLDHVDLCHCNWLLRTRDAQAVYRPLGFSEVAAMWRGWDGRDPCGASSGA